MTKEEFINEETFTYTGHFNGLKGKELHYHRAVQLLELKERRRDGKSKDSLIDHDPWTIFSINHDRFYIHRPEYGRVMILFNECQIKKPE